ncbi:MAG: alpha-L-rhamnosidase N-terminal domain-containing protein [Kordiimonadaceae bacterium]|nr:alpha-L-rhamnosidase N-terminal domain-containing protein [Kordiimonadaceae bacterium]
MTIFLGACSSEVSVKAPVSLTVNEGITDPLGFHDATPSFSWKLVDSRQGAKQTAYQITASAPDAENTVLWDSGKVVSRQSVYVPYEGSTLQSRQRVVWKVRYWDQEDKVSGWSDTAVIELGLLANTAWQAEWIHAVKPDATKKADCTSDCVTEKRLAHTANPATYLRKTFQLDAAPEKARLYLTARGLVDFRINGQLVTPNAFLPGWTDYKQKIETLTYDVTGLLEQGENVLAARITDGWYAGDISKRVYGKIPELLAQLEMTSSTGELRTVMTDASWAHSTNGAITMAAIWHGEDYDARKELTGWDIAKLCRGRPVRACVCNGS